MKHKITKEKLKAWCNKVLDFLVPPNIKCVFCGNEIEVPNKFHACQHCLKNLPFNNQKVCSICGAKIIDEAKICIFCFYSPPPFNIARAPFLYEHPISSVVSALKFNNAKYLVEPLGEFMAEEYLKMGVKADVIVPVPLSPARQKTRHYNQAELLANFLGKKFEILVNTNTVRRTRNTVAQSTLNWRQRQKNMVDAFELVSKKELKGKNVLVIDDVITTGATIKSLCHEIQKAKPNKIYVLTIAHTNIDRKIVQNKNILIKLKRKIKPIIQEKIIKKIKNKLKINKNN